MLIMLGWAKASKCKKLLKRVRSRLECLQNEGSAHSIQLRKDIEKLDYEALNIRIEQEQRIRNESSAYDLVDHFCKLILMHFFYIRTHKNCRQRNLAEAVSSLVFASSRLRCGGIPELQEIRDLLGERYGESFVETAVKLLPGNLVNPIFKKYILALSPDSVVQTDIVKHEPIIHSCANSSPEKKDDEDGKKQLQVITFQAPKHVHPKLPDWNDILTEFSALNKPENENPKLPKYNIGIATKNENTAENYQSQLEYHDDHNNVDDGAVFRSSWLSIESIRFAIEQECY